MLSRRLVSIFALVAGHTIGITALGAELPPNASVEGALYFITESTPEQHKKVTGVVNSPTSIDNDFVRVAFELERAGGSGAVMGKIDFGQDDEQVLPSLRLFVHASANRVEDENAPFLIQNGYTAAVTVTFEDDLRINAIDPLVAAVGMKVAMDGTLGSSIQLNPFEAPFHADAHLEYHVEWGSNRLDKHWNRAGITDDQGHIDHDTFEDDLNWIKNVEESLTLPALNIFSDTHVKLSMTARAAADNGFYGVTESYVDASHTFKIVGLVPYDAQGNVLPSSSISVSSAYGFNYPIVVPEPTGLCAAAMVLLLSVRRRRSA